MALVSRGLRVSLVAALALLLGATPGAFAKKKAKMPANSLPALKAVEGLEPAALRRFPDTFGGLWLGQHGNVFIAFTGGGKRNVARLGKSFPRPKRLHAVQVDDSLAALRSLEARMVVERGHDPPVARLIYDLQIDVMRNLVLATIDKPVTPAITTAFTARYGPDAVVEQGLLGKPVACSSRYFCAPDLRAGLLVHPAQAMNGNTFCSSGFTGHVGAAQVILSAAHCGQIPDSEMGAPPDLGAERWHGGSKYGSVTMEQQAGQLDAEVHTIQDFNLFNALKPWVYRTDLNAATKQGVVGAVGTYDKTPVGLSVCLTGVWGQRCGKVLSKGFSPYYVTNGMDFVKTSACGEKGQSGGPVYHQYVKYPPFNAKKTSGKRYLAIGPPGGNKASAIRLQALGVVSGGTGPPCPDPNGFSTFGHIEFISQTFGLTVNTAP